MTGKVWKLSDTVAAAFLGIWLFSLFFRPFFGGLDIIVFIVAGVWGLSVWARAKHGEYVQPELTEEQKVMMADLDRQRQEMLVNPAYDQLSSNAFHRSND